MSLRNEYGKLRSVLLCKPEYFALQPINVIAEDYIRRGDLPVHDQVLSEHAEFSQAIRDSGVEILWVDPDPELPFQVFTRDIGVATSRGVLFGAFREPVRRLERARAEAILTSKIPIWRKFEASPEVVFEGGDYMYVDETKVAIGVGARTTPKGVEFLQSLAPELEIELIPVEFDPRFLHLDMIFCVVGDRVCTICKEALPDHFLRMVDNWGFETIEVPPEGVFNLNCNLLSLDDGVVISPARNKNVNRQLKALGLEVVEVDLDHLLRGGGGPHCMTFPIERD